MAFKSFTSVSEAARCIQDFLFDRDAALPDDLRETLRDLVGPSVSPVDSVVKGAELMYARKDELPAEAQELAAGLALLAQQYNFHGLATDNRGSRMALALMRDAKIKAPTGVSYPKKEDDPAANGAFVPKTEFVSEANVVVTPPPVPVEETPKIEGSRRGRGRRDKNAINTK